MAGVTAQLTTIGLDQAIKAVARLEGARLAEFADDAGAVLESSTRERFETKEAPDGADWPAWSDEYAATRKAHHSLLIGEGYLEGSIASLTSAAQVEIGSNLVYAARQHFGDEDSGGGIPERPFLGVSDQDEGDLKDLAQDWLGRLVQ